MTFLFPQITQDIGELTFVPIEIKKRPVAPVRAIQMEVCEQRGITMAQMLGPQRTRKVAWARQEAMIRAYYETGKGVCAIGRAFNRDHTTVSYALTKGVRHE